MDIVALTAKRYTAKAYDKNKKISDADLDKICTALRNSPSSVNSQPWHFFMISTDQAKEQVKEAIRDFNQPRIMNASHVVVMCAKNEFSQEHFENLLAQEEQDGRFSNDEQKKAQDSGRRYFVGLNDTTPEDLLAWEGKQVYMAAGFLILAAASLGIDSTPIEGFYADKMDEALGLADKGLKSVLVISLGYHSAEDFNAQIPKSRLPKDQIFTFM